MFIELEGCVWINTANIVAFDENPEGGTRILYSNDVSKILPNTSPRLLAESLNGLISAQSNELRDEIASAIHSLEHTLISIARNR